MMSTQEDDMNGKTWEEMAAITLEAGRRVRAGERQVDVARALGIPTSTLADWARNGGWRRKDLKAVRDAQHGEQIQKLIAGMVSAERETDNAHAAQMREVLEASKAELDAIAPGAMFPGAMGEGAVGGLRPGCPPGCSLC
jgi:hypothetical protein